MIAPCVMRETMSMQIMSLHVPGPWRARYRVTEGLRPAANATHGAGETMPMRDRGKPQSQGSGRRRSRAARGGTRRRHTRTRSGALLLLGAFVAPAGQASAASERSSAEQEALSAARTAEKEARTAATQAQRESE